MLCICILSHPSDKQAIAEFCTKLMHAYEFRELGELSWYIGIRIVRDRLQRKLWLCQDSYIDKIVSLYKLPVVTLPKTPMATDNLRPNIGQVTQLEIHLYQQKVGSVNDAAVVTRLDIARTTQKLSEFLMNPGPEHAEVADRLIQYLRATQCYALRFGP